jgi:predicted AlkP superfamily phosphohydrolase/phosphomutase
MAALLVGTLTTGWSIARAEEPPAAPPDHLRVTIIGLDGAAWRVLDPLLGRGEMPNFARLVRTGVRAPLRSRMPLTSPAVWTTVATGMRREQHGIINFHTSGDRLSATTNRKSPTLWTLASDAGLRSAVIGWWVTYPAERIDGMIISERALMTRDADLRALDGRPAGQTLPGLFHPPTVTTVVGDLLAELSAVAPDDGNRATTVRRMRAEDATVVSILRRLREQSGPFDLEMILLRGIDPVSHHFWKFHEPDAPGYEADDRPRAADVARDGSTIEDYYRYVDTLLGQVLPAGPGHVVMLVSDHGFEAGHQPFRDGVLSGTHRTSAALYGIFVASGPPIVPGKRLGLVTILDVAPTVLHLLGLPVAETHEGHVLTQAFASDWAAAHPVETVPAYTGPAVALPVTEETAAGPDSPVDEQLRERLRALGYIE